MVLVIIQYSYFKNLMTILNTDVKQIESLSEIIN